MDLSAEEFVDQLLTEEALEKPSDTVKHDELVLELPEWFDEEKFNRGRKFYWSHCYAFSTSMVLGLIAVFAVPSILAVLVGSRRSSSSYTSYKRYLSTLLHTVSWFKHELKPGSISWKSLFAVRSRHIRAGLASKMKGGHYVSQRDIALTQFGFVGFSMLRPDFFGIRQFEEGDWDAYNHVWRTVGYMIGLEDRYNICRENIDKTLEVCELIKQRVYTPCLENVPEYFEHMTRVMMDGLWSINPSLECDAILYATKYLADVPGYIYTEGDRIKLCNALKQQLKGKPLDSGVDSRLLISETPIKGLPERAPRLLYLKDFQSIDNSLEFKKLSFFSRYKLCFTFLAFSWYVTYLGKLYFNLNFLWSLLLMKYFPFLAFHRFGFKQSFVDIFKEDPVDDTKPKPNSEYLKEKVVMPWYREWLSIIW